MERRGVKELEGQVTPDEYIKIKGFIHMKTSEDLDAFTAFIRSLQNKKVTGTCSFVLFRDDADKNVRLVESQNDAYMDSSAHCESFLRY